ncbi:MAG: hypothetical protein ACRYFX_20065 [Janthinobacterium lividum]
MSKHLFISTQVGTWTLTDLRRVLSVSCSGYYQWRAASPPPVPDWQPDLTMWRDACSRRVVD